MNNIQPIDTKEVAVLQKKVSRAVADAESVVVTTDEEMLRAGELRKENKILGKGIETRKKEITDPMNQAIKSVRALFAPLEEGFEKAEKLLARKMLDFQDKQDNIRQKAQDEVDRKAEETRKKLEEGKISEKQATLLVEKAETKLDRVPEAILKSETFHTRVEKKFRIVNLSLIPIEYHLANEVMIRKVMYAGIQLPGVEYFDEKILV